MKARFRRCNLSEVRIFFMTSCKGLPMEGIKGPRITLPGTEAPPPAHEQCCPILKIPCRFHPVPLKRDSAISTSNGDVPCATYKRGVRQRA